MQRVLLVALMALSVMGCQWGYYSQVIRGHGALMAERQPVERVLRAQATSPHTASQLQLTREVLAFSGEHLQLPSRRVYRSYVPLDSPAVVWNLMAAPAFSLQPKTWCFPVAGCVSYRGYFDRAAAEQAAAELAEQGWDTHISGAVAYSTLGWFADPLTTPMLNRPAPDLVDLLIHELTHRRLYVKNDTRFNESLATMVAREGTLQFYSRRDDDVDSQYWQRQDRARQQFLSMVLETREALAVLYASEQPVALMAAEKARLQQELRQRFDQQRQQVPGLDRYQGFFAGALNNAQLNGVSDYYQWVPAFQAMLLHCGGYWDCFWTEVEGLAAMAPLQRQAALQQWLAEQPEGVEK